MKRKVMIVGLIAGGEAASPALATDFTWTGSFNTLFQAAPNWSPFSFGPPPVVGPPGPTEMATFDLGNATYSVTFNASHTSLRTRIGDDTVTFNLGGFTFANTSTTSPAIALGYGIGAGDQANLTLTNGALAGQDADIAAVGGMAGASMIVGSGGTLNLTGQLSIGTLDNGTLTVLSGGDVTCANAVLGESTTSVPLPSTGNGTATVTGAGSTWTVDDVLTIGGVGPGSITVSAGGSLATDHDSLDDFAAEVRAGQSASGALSITGANSTCFTSDLRIGVGHMGTLIIQSGGVAFCNLGVLGSVAGVTGTATISGAGSMLRLWELNSLYTDRLGDLRIGDAGTGSINVSAGARVGLYDGEINNAVGATLGYAPGSSGTLNLDGAGTRLRLSEALQVGRDGTGMMTISNGALADTCDSYSTSSFYTADGIGRELGAIGVVTVDGAGSHWNAHRPLVVGSTLGGHGELHVINGADVTINETQQWWAGLYVGSPAGADVMVDGAGSTMTLYYGPMQIGAGGVLQVSNGGAVGSVATAEVIGGVLELDNGAMNTSVLVQAGGIVRGRGTISGSLNNQGVVSPGLTGAAGLLQVGTTCTQNASCSLSIDIGGAAPGTEHDRLNVGGNVTLGGTLNLALVGGFTPAPGQQFVIINSSGGAIDGTFAAVNPPNTWQVIYSAQNVVVQMIDDCPADINSDNAVNVTDLLAVISSWGSCANPCPPRCPADIAPIRAGDCAVNVSDLLAVIGAWGACP